MSAIILQFSRQRDLPSDLIAWFGHGAGFSHVDAVLPGPPFGPAGYLLGARHDIRMGVPAGVQVRPPHYADWERVLLVSLPAPPEMAVRFYTEVCKEIGKPYDTRAILGFASGRDWRSPDAWFCSELQGRKLEVVGWFPAPLATPAAKLDPDDLLLAASARTRIGPPETVNA